MIICKVTPGSRCTVIMTIFSIPTFHCVTFFPLRRQNHQDDATSLVSANVQNVQTYVHRFMLKLPNIENQEKYTLLYIKPRTGFETHRVRLKTLLLEIELYLVLEHSFTVHICYENEKCDGNNNGRDDDRKDNDGRDLGIRIPLYYDLEKCKLIVRLVEGSFQDRLDNVCIRV
jgi:hypothetical protein